MRRAALLVLLIVACSKADAGDNADALQPAETLSALQRVQDAIAAGDASALPLQAELIALMDKSFATAAKAGGGDAELFFAYALAGGSRSTFAGFIKHGALKPETQELAEAVSAYVAGDAAKAQEHFEKIDAQLLHPRLAALAALAKGTANIRENPGTAIRNFDIARLMAPGTLIEEVALRRTISLEAERGNAPEFLRASEQYARRFIRSPYAAQFAEAFVSGAVAMDDAISDDVLAAVLGTVPADWRNALYLRITRHALIAGHLPLAAFAAGEALRDGALAKEKARGAQIALYSLIPDLTKADAAMLQGKLGKIEASQLPEDDRLLLQAAQKIVEAIARPFEPGKGGASKPPETVATGVSGATAAAPVSPDPVDESIAANKQKLAAIDALLEAAQ